MINYINDTNFLKFVENIQNKDIFLYKNPAFSLGRTEWQIISNKKYPVNIRLNANEDELSISYYYPGPRNKHLESFVFNYLNDVKKYLETVISENEKLRLLILTGALQITINGPFK
jgi:hypothetical protein